MLNDDFDQFHLDQEVVYDSSCPRESPAGRLNSIFDEVKLVSGEKLLASCYRDQILELICMVLPEDSSLSSSSLLQSAPDKSCGDGISQIFRPDADSIEESPTTSNMLRLISLNEIRRLSSVGSSTDNMMIP